LDGGKRQVSALDAPRGLGHHLARREGPLGDAPLDHRGTDSQRLGRLRERQPVVPLGEIREPIWIADTGDTGRSPSFACPRPIAQAIERGGNGEVTIDLGEFRNDANDIVLRRPAMLAGRIACHTYLGVYPAVPVQTPKRFGRFSRAIEHNLLQDGAEDAFFEPLWSCGMMPHRAQSLAQSESLLALLLTEWDVTLLQRREVRLRVLHPLQRLVPAMVSFTRHQAVCGIGEGILPTGPLGFIARFLQRQG
jgi:hypothetical protein